MMFWRTSPKTSPKRESGSPNKNRKVSTPKERKVHHFHDNPAKSWSYYDNAAQSERNSLIKAPKIDTTSTTESSTWTTSIEQLLLEDEPLEEEEVFTEYFFCPEGVTRTPFSVWEVDLQGTARLASYFQRSVNAFFPKRANSNELARERKKPFSPRQRVSSSTTSTPNNSPRPTL